MPDCEAPGDRACVGDADDVPDSDADAVDDGEDEKVCVGV